jgi:hypothetical protein
VEDRKRTERIGRRLERGMRKMKESDYDDKMKEEQTNSVAFSPQANYTD